MTVLTMLWCVVVKEERMRRCGGERERFDKKVRQVAL